MTAAPGPARKTLLAAALCTVLLPACETAGRTDIRRVVIESPAMGRPWPALVCLPPSYGLEPERRFPVLYLLHGAKGEHSSWLRSTPLARLLGTRDLIVVCPNGRVYGWYVDSQYRPNSNVETHIVKELIPYVDREFRTDPRREARAIAGYSMGGHGALTLAAKHPELFSSASSLSGILDTVRWLGHWGLEGTFGPLEESRGSWVASSAMGRAEDFTGRAREVRLLVDCGFDDVAYPENVDFHEKLLSLGVPHEYRERRGRHNWAYWSAHLAEHLDFHLESFRPAEPEAAGQKSGKN